MSLQKEKSMNLIEMKDFLDYEQRIKTNDKIFPKLMFIYEIALKELSTKLEIIKQEFEVFYDYHLIDHINTRIKEPESIVNKMKKKECKLTYEDMIKNVNDIAGIRVICPLKKDIFSIRKSIAELPEINIVREKDYVNHPKKSGYSAYHMILHVPIVLSGQIIYVKVELQIRTMAMDFWSSLEHEMKYKAKGKVKKKDSKEWINCAKMINKLDNKMVVLNN